MSVSQSENSRTYIGFVVDREDPTKTGGHRIFCPQLHGKDVKVDDLPFCRFMVPPGQSAATTNHGALDYGQMVYFRKDKGEGGTGLGTIVGLPQTKRKSNSNLPGNVSLISFLPQISEALSKELPVRIKPNITEKMVDGARMRVAEEKGQKHKHTLLDGIIGHGSAFPLNGTILPQVTNVSTGVDATANMLTSSLQSLLPNLPINLNNLLSLIPKQLLDELTSKLDPEVLTALTNTTALMSSVSTMAVDGAFSPGSISGNPITFATNAVKSLSNMTNTSDISSVMSDLLTNTAMHGASSGGISSSISTPFGQVPLNLDPVTGALSSLVPDSIQQALNAFSGLVGSLPGAGGANLFGNSSEVIAKMGQRLADPALTQKFNDKLEKNVSTSKGTDPRKKVNQDGGSTNDMAIGAARFLGSI